LGGGSSLERREAAAPPPNDEEITPPMAPSPRKTWIALLNAAATIVAVSILSVAPGCTDAGLQTEPEPIRYVDDQLALSGRFCTSPADEVVFPVKLLIVVDQSASLQCTDAGGNRLTALNQAGSALDALPNVQFGVVGFASWSRISTQPGGETVFTSNWSAVRDQLAPESGQGGPATDYQGALSTVLRVLEQDMLHVGPAERARTKYVVLFLSDGLPEPRCRSGCDDGDSTPDSLYPVCNTTETIPDGVYVDMNSLCPDYNQQTQIVQKVQDIMSLADFYGVGDLTLNTVFLFAPDEEVAAICGDVAQFGYVREEAEPILRAMAEEGRGTFRDVNISTEIEFLEYNYESLSSPFELTELFALNTNAVRVSSGFAPDSDRDGVPDDREFELGLDRLDADSDNDRFSDLFELKFQTRGFSADDGDVPAIGCAVTHDRDADGLRACEEAFLGTDPLLPDSDGDRIPDGVELRVGLDPSTHDTAVDHDFDGRLSGAEVRAGTSPLLLDKETSVLDQIRYDVVPGPAAVDQSRCYDFTIEGITLVPTLSDPDERELKGRNRILVYAVEEPGAMGGSRGRFHVACVEARYLSETYKDPPSGRLDDLGRWRFHELVEFDPEEHCVKVGEDPSALPDGGLPE